MQNEMYLSSQVPFPGNLMGHEWTTTWAKKMGFNKVERVPVKRDGNKLPTGVERQCVSWRDYERSWRNVLESPKHGGFLKFPLSAMTWAGLQVMEESLDQLDPKLPTVIYPALIDLAKDKGFEQIHVHINGPEEESWKTLDGHVDKGVGLVLDTQVTPGHRWLPSLERYQDHIAEVHVRCGMDKEDWQEQLRTLVWGKFDQYPLSILEVVPENIPIVCEVAWHTIKWAGMGKPQWAYSQIRRHVLAAAGRN